jgi:hypothetical protein
MPTLPLWEVADVNSWDKQSAGGNYCLRIHLELFLNA